MAPSKFLSRFYRVPFKSLLRVQIKRVSNDPFLWYFENNFGPLPKTTWPLSILQKNLWHCQVSAWLIITIAILNVFITDQCSVVSCYQRFVPSIGNIEKTIGVFNYFGRLGLFGGTLSPASVVPTDQKRTVYFLAALHFYSIANYVASWLKWLQMISNDSKCLQLTY